MLEDANLCKSILVKMAYMERAMDTFKHGAQD